jgi:hypothetical protein
VAELTQPGFNSPFQQQKIQRMPAIHETDDLAARGLSITCRVGGEGTLASLPTSTLSAETSRMVLGRQQTEKKGCRTEEEVPGLVNTSS